MFDEILFRVEMSRLLGDAVETLQRIRPGLVVYSVSIWTDPDAAVSAVSIDTKENSDAKLTALAAWASAHRAAAVAAGDSELAARLGAFPPRNQNPADFVLREIATVEHRSFASHWEADSGGDCWRELGPALRELRSHAAKLFSTFPLHADAELAVSSARDWYDAPISLHPQAI